jgi:putative ABC transport system permease protein
MHLPLWRRRRDEELDEEIRAHLAMAVRDRVERGESEDEAQYRARHEFGNVALVKEVTREMWGWRWLERIVQDVRYGVRLMAKSRAFTAMIVLSLALGIGAVSTVFALINAIELKTLPVSKPGDLVWLQSPSFSYPIFRQLRDRGWMFDGLFAWQLRDLTVRWGEDPEPVRALLVTGDFYRTLGVTPIAGRPIAPEDDVAGAPRPVAVLSHAAWVRRFAGDPGIVGRTVLVERMPFTIVGIAPPGFFGVAVGTAPEITIPLTTVPLLRAENRDTLTMTGRAWLHIMGRLRPGVSRAQAEPAFQVIWHKTLEATTPLTETPARRARYLARATALMPGATGHSAVRNQFSEPLWLLFALVGLLLLVSCAAVANLLLARSSARQRELAVRLAIGASRGRLVRQLLVEGLVLSLLGAMAGLAVAVWSADVLVRSVSTAALPVALDVALDWRILAFTSAIACAVALVFTIAPVMASLRVDPGDVIKSGGARLGGAAPRESRSARLLVAAQMAFSLLLLAGAALFLRSLGTLVAQDSGVDASNLFVVSAEPRPGTDREVFYRDLLDRAAAVPGVTAASLSWVPPISDSLGSWTQSIGIDGAPPDRDVAHSAPDATFFNAVSPGYFDTVGTALVSGRDVRWTDTQTAPRVAIVNESLARAYFPGQSPIGHRITIGLAAARKDLEIVGVVRDAKYQRLQEPTRRIAYLPYLQLPEFIAGNNLVAEVRLARSSASTIAAVHEIPRALGTTSPVLIEAMESRIRDSLVRERLIAFVATLLSIFSLVLCCGSLYGLMSQVVARRTNEIGIRVALGAPAASVVWMVVRDTLKVALAGAAAGLLLAASNTRVAQRFLYGVSSMDAGSLAAAAAVLLAMALMAGYLPARRAARVDPVVALRCE